MLIQVQEASRTPNIHNQIEPLHGILLKSAMENCEATYSSKPNKIFPTETLKTMRAWKAIFQALKNNFQTYLTQKSYLS
jgi:hypothetical protein